MFRAALDTTISTSPSTSTAALANWADRVPVGQVEMEGDGLAPVGSDGRRRGLALVDPAGTEHHGVPE